MMRPRRVNDPIKAWLWRAADAGRAIDELLMEMEEVHARRTRITSTLGEVGSGGVYVDGRVDATIRLIALERRLESRIARYCAVRDAVEAAIDGLERPLQRDVMRMRYLLGMTFDAIAEARSVSVRTVYTMHGRALANLARAGVMDRDRPGA